RRLAGSGEPRLQAPQPGRLRADAGPERTWGERQAREVGPLSGSEEHHRTHARDWRGARHDGSRAHEMDGGPDPAREVPAVPERQSSRGVRRPAGVLFGIDWVSDGEVSADRRLITCDREIGGSGDLRSRDRGIEGSETLAHVSLVADLMQPCSIA